MVSVVEGLGEYSFPSRSHFEKMLHPTWTGAVRDTEVVLLYFRVNAVLPSDCPLLSIGTTEMGTPAAGFDDITVRVTG
jgi:hypothetical protein